MIGFLAPAPPVDRLPPERIDPVYRRLRRQVFAGIFLGYAAYYLVRKNMSLAIPDILAHYPQYSKAQLGTAMTGLSMAYGVSKFLMGSISDRSNPRYFLPLGLLLSCGITMICGFSKAIYSSLALIIVLQTLNGWVNGMGWPPCGKTMVHWFSTRERGRTVAVWNLAHNIGGALVATFATAGVMLFHDWGAKFYFNAFIAAGVAVVAFLLLRDTPQSCGLPPVEEYKNDYPPGYTENHEKPLSLRDIFLRHVLTNPWLLAIAVANVFVYFVRNGIADWIPTYLRTAKHFSESQAAWGFSLFEYAGIPGTLLCGWMSDRVFKGRRAPATMAFMGLTMLGVMVYAANRTGPLWIDYASLTAIGFFIYGPVMMVGLHALDLVPKKAAGTAAGFTGFFGYVFGSATAGTGVGWISDHWGWGSVFTVMIVCCLLTILFSGLTLLQKPQADRAG
ncbi:MAG: phosphoglycerate transporter protein PgtP [Verrucomicrobiota bacterium]